MSWAYVAVAAVSVASSAYSSDQQRKAGHKQQAAIDAAKDEDARKAAEAETAAQVAANSKLADTKRRRRASALELGDPTATAGALGGGGTNALSAGGPTPAARASHSYAGAAAAYPAGTVLGAGSPNVGRVGGIPKSPPRSTAI